MASENRKSEEADALLSADGVGMASENTKSEESDAYWKMAKCVCMKTAQKSYEILSILHENSIDA